MTQGIIKSATGTFSTLARYLKATLIQSSTGRYFVAVDGDLPTEAMFAEYCGRQNTLTLKLDNHQTLSLAQDLDSEFCGKIGKQKSIYLVRADDQTKKIKLPLVVQ